MKLYIAILLVYYVLAQQSQDPCSFPDSSRYYRYNQTIDCIRSVKFSADIVSKTLDTLQALYPSYVYKDLVKNSPLNGSPYNITTTIEDNLAQLRTSTFTTDYDFHANLTSIFMKLKDTNTRYRKPTCYSQFTFVQPFPLVSSIQTVNNTKVQVLSVGKTDSIAQQFYPQLYTEYNVTSFGKYENLRVLQINGVDAMEYMIKNCAEPSPRSKDVQVAFNHCLIRDWQVQFIYIFNYPQTQTITYTLFNETSQEAIVVPVNWLVATTNTFSKSSDFANLCVQQDDNMLAYMNAINYNPGPSFTDRLSNTLLQTPDFSMSTFNNDYAILRLFTFLPTQGNTANEIMSTFEALKPRGQISKLIIDLRAGLSGGDDCFAYSLAQYLIPSVPYVPNYPIDMIQSSLLVSLFNCPATSGNNDLSLLYSTQNMSYMENGRNWFLQGIQRTRGGNTSTYSQLAHRQCTDGYSSDYYFFRRCPYRWTPQNLIIITDGTCDGSCAIFVKMLQQLRKAVVVTVGGIYAMNTPMEPVSTKSARTTPYKTFISYLQASASSCPIAVPSAFPSTADFNIMLEEPYGYNPTVSAYEKFRTSTDLPMEFTSLGADYRVLNWNFTNNENIYASVTPLFSQCTSWQYQENGCIPSSGIANGIYGSPCNQSLYDTKQCVLFSCNDGYYLNGTCQSVPQPDRTIGSRIALKIGMGVLGSLIGIVLFVVVPIAIAIAIVVKKRNLI